LYAVDDALSRQTRLFVSAGQVSDYAVAAALLESFLEADWLQADRGHDANWYSDALKDKEDEPCSPGRQSRKSL